MTKAMDEELREYLKLKLHSALRDFDMSVPDHMRDGLELYLLRGVEPGSFLRAVLENDFKRAFACADYMNLGAMKNWACLMSNGLPSDAQGSPAKVEAWMNFARGESIS